MKERRTYHIQSKSGLSGNGDIDTTDPGPREGSSRQLGLASQDGSTATGSLDGPSEKCKGSNDSSHRLDEEQPSHLSRMDHDQWELDCCQLVSLKTADEGQAY
jgi:hypothetical protein